MDSYFILIAQFCQRKRQKGIPLPHGFMVKRMKRKPSALRWGKGVLDWSPMPCVVLWRSNARSVPGPSGIDTGMSQTGGWPFWLRKIICKSMGWKRFQIHPNSRQSHHSRFRSCKNRWWILAPTLYDFVRCMSHKQQEAIAYAEGNRLRIPPRHKMICKNWSGSLLKGLSVSIPWSLEVLNRLKLRRWQRLFFRV